MTDWGELVRIKSLMNREVFKLNFLGQLWITIFFLPLAKWSQGPNGGGTSEESRNRFPRRDQDAGLVREARQLHHRDGEAGECQGPFRLHHRERSPARGARPELFPPGAGGCEALPRQWGSAQGHQGREHPDRPEEWGAKADRLRLGRAAQGHSLHGLRR